MNKIVCVAGLCGAGKSIVSDYFVNKGFQFIRFGQVVLDEVKRKNLIPNEKNERVIREEIRNKYGMAAMALLNLPKFKKFLKKGNIIVDGLYSWAEYLVLKKNFADRLVVIAVYAPTKLRYERISKRVMPKKDTDLRHRPFTKREAKARDYAEIENLDKGGPIAMADYTILNTKDLNFLLKQVRQIYKGIIKS